jgi:hypothetical protein
MKFPADWPKGIFLESQFEWLSRHFLTLRLGGYFQSNQQKQRSNTIEKFSNPNYEKEVGPQEKRRMWLRQNR